MSDTITTEMFDFYSAAAFIGVEYDSITFNDEATHWLEGKCDCIRLVFNLGRWTVQVSRNEGNPSVAPSCLRLSHALVRAIEIVKDWEEWK